MTESLPKAVAHDIVLLDGGLATELERRGNDLSSPLWSASLLVERPDEIVAAHRAFRAAGAQVAITASYQASLGGFRAAGYPDIDAAQMLRRSVTLAREAMGTDGWVAASIGPYGAVLADGSEYRGDYGLSISELRRFHRPRLESLAASGPDVLAVETIPCLTEVEALLAELERVDVPAWLSLTCVGDRTRAGEPAMEGFAMAADCQSVFAVGVNCTDPADVNALVSLAADAFGRPVVVYPNSGERWDPRKRTWLGSSRFNPAEVRSWISAGARLIGGCCRVGPDQIREIAAAVRTG